MKLALFVPLALVSVVASAQDTESFRWKGRVDGIDDILIQGSSVRVEHIAAEPIQRQDYRFSAPLPFAAVDLELEVRKGRGDVRIMEQPSQRNQFTAVVRVDDGDQSGASDYEFELTWSRKESRNRDAYTYAFKWRGRVDIGCDIEIHGRTHKVLDKGGSGTQEKNASFDAPLPDSSVPVSVDKKHGRGKVMLVQTPSSSNDYTAVVRIEDDKGGADDYEFELTWPRQ